ncbi:hypothetical protein ABZ504_03075 [Streptomyces mirabilis]|uniref:hypothetical protein n=1 Tax=Streptomyces mirabilis TaxID=68239 RepID=UPI003407C931
MSDHDIQTLAFGFILGAYLVLAVQIVFWMLDDRRDRKAARAARAELEAAREK